MADDNVIKEFLVSLGYKVGSSEREFTNALEGATLRANLLGDAIEATAKKIGDAVLETAKNFSTLYFETSRMQSSVDALRAFQFATTQFGGSAEEAAAAVRSFNSAMERQPGIEGVINSLGVVTRTVHGNMRDTADILADIGPKIAQMPIAIQHQYASMLGLSEEMFKIITNPDFKKFEEQHRDFAKAIGFDEEQAGKESAAFVRQWTTAIDEITSMLSNAETKILKSFTGPLEQVNEFVNKSAPEIRKISDDFDKATTQLGADIKILLGDQTSAGTEVLVSFGRATTELTQDIDRLVKALIAFSTFIDYLTGTTGWDRIKAMYGFMSQGPFAWLNPGGAILQQVSPDSSAAGAMGAIGGWWQRNMPSWLGGGGASANPTQNSGMPHWWTQDRINHAVDRLMNEGGLSKVGAAALVARWTREAPGGPSTVNGIGATGIAQWLGGRRQPGMEQWDFDRQIGYAIQEGKSSEARAWRTLTGAQTEAEGAIGATQFERAEGYNGVTDILTNSTPVRAVLDLIRGRSAQAAPVDPGVIGAAPKGWGAISLAPPPVAGVSWAGGLGSAGDFNSHNRSMSSNNTFNIYGGGDPNEAAAMVGLHIERTNQDWARFLQGNTQ